MLTWLRLDCFFILSSVESNAVLSPGSKAILSSGESNIPKTIKKPIIDMVNDYEPFIDFKFVFPLIMPIVKNHAVLLLVILVNSGAMQGLTSLGKDVQNLDELGKT